MSSQIVSAPGKHSAIVVSGNNVAAITTNWDKRNERSRSTVLKNPDKLGNVAAWGEANDFPQKVVEDIRSSDLLAPIIDWKAKALYSGGLVYGKAIIENRQKIMEPMFDPEIEDFLEATNSARFLRSSCEQYYKFYNGFPQLNLNVPRNKIVNLSWNDVTECRRELQDKNGFINNTFINANWDNGGNESNSIVIPTLDPNLDMVSQIRDTKKYSYIIPMGVPADGNKYYEIPPWNGIRVSGWLDIAKEIPRFKKALLKNALSIKWHIQINYNYWTWKYKDFQSKSDDEKKKLIDEELATFVDLMSGESAGNTLFSPFDIDVNGKKIPAWEVTQLPNDLKGGEYLQDSQEIDFRIARAFGMDPTLMGIGPGKDRTSGSGSDKRMAFNQYMINEKPIADRILEPFKVAARFNKWTEKHSKENQKFCFWFENYRIATLDQDETQKAA